MVMANPGSNNVHLRDGAFSIVLNPDHAEIINRAGLTREDAQSELARRATISVGTLRKVGSKFSVRDDQNDDELVQVLKDPSKIILFQAGGSGLYTMVMPSWCAGPHKNAVVHAEIELDQACEIPAMTLQ